MISLLIITLTIFHCCSYVRCKLIELNDTNFDASTSAGNWFVEFYAPWCHHCKHLKPVIEQLSTKQSSSSIHIGIVDATKSKKIAKQLEISRYPTLWYKHGKNSSGIYDGVRTLEGFTSFLDRLQYPSVKDIISMEDLSDLFIRSEDVVFLFTIPEQYLNQNNNYSEQFNTFNIFQSVAMDLHLHASFGLFIRRNEEKSFPILDKLGDYNFVKLEKNRKFIKFFDIQKFGGDYQAMRSFVEQNNYPLINKFDNHNFRRLSRLNKTMILAIVDYQKKALTNELLTTFDQVLTTWSPTTITLKDQVDVTDELIFGHVDSQRYHKFMKDHHASLFSVLVLNMANDMHRTFTIRELKEESGSMKERIQSIIVTALEDQIDWEPSIPPTLFQRIVLRFDEYYPFSIFILLIPIILLIISFVFVEHPDKKKLKKH